MQSAGRSLIFNVRPRTTNVGNELIALGLRRLLTNTWPERCDLVPLPSTGPATGLGSGLTARSVYEAGHLADAVIVGGGNVFENGALDVDPVALNALQVPLALIGVSCGGVFSRDGRLVDRTDRLSPNLMADVCAAASPILVRDDATAKALVELGIEGVAVAACPVLAIDTTLDLAPPVSELAGTALVSIRHPRLMSVSYAQQSRVHADVERIVAGLARRYERVGLLCHDVQDLSFAAALDGVRSYYSDDPRVVAGWLRDCAVSVGYRLHAFLTAVAVGSTAIHVSYDERGASMIGTLGADVCDVPMIQMTDLAGTVLERVDLLRGRPTRELLGARIRELTDTLTAGIDQLAQRVHARRAAV
jgi:hypothetical protein